MPLKLESPWKEFLEELDSLLAEPLEVHCVGGFAILSTYGLKRSTNDLDYFTLVPNNVTQLHGLAGPGSALAKKYHVYVQHAAVATLPENYEERLVEPFARHLKNLRLRVPDPYDLVLSKLSRNSAVDREDVAFLAETLGLDENLLRDRYERELTSLLVGPIERHDATLTLWIDAYFHKT